MASGEENVSLKLISLQQLLDCQTLVSENGTYSGSFVRWTFHPNISVRSMLIITFVDLGCVPGRLMPCDSGGLLDERYQRRECDKLVATRANHIVEQHPCFPPWHPLRSLARRIHFRRTLPNQGA